MEILCIENLSFTYPLAEHSALESVSFSVRQGEFVVLFGGTGCGKTTLLRLIKRELAPHGTRTGNVFLHDAPMDTLDARASAAEIGFVMQNPENQIVTDKVWHELAFGAESLGLPTQVIRRRVAETASWLGIEGWFRQDTDTLSGGQKQLLNLASVLVMQPKILLLDEPTAQLDPIAATEFLNTLARLNREMGMTILLVEHRLEEAFALADRVLLLEKGHLIMDAAPHAVAEALCKTSPPHPMCEALPSAARIYRLLGAKKERCPISVREGRELLQDYSFSAPLPKAPDAALKSGTVLAELREVWFRYARDLPDVLRGLTLQLYAGEICCVLGGNGVGKTTLLNLLAGTDKPYRGKVRLAKKESGYAKTALLPQDPLLLFTEDTVRADLLSLLQIVGVPKNEREARVAAVAQELHIETLLDRHPFDLSGGEQQKCALSKVLLTNPDLLLLDEPTKGMDAAYKQGLKMLLRTLREKGLCILIVTHDAEFAAETADRCALLFDGEILSAAPPCDFFSENYFYTTAANRIARGFCEHAVTCEAVAAAAKPRGKADAPC